MQMYSPDELDVMAEAYSRAIEKLSGPGWSSSFAQKVVQEIGWAVSNGIRDEDALADLALARTSGTASN